MFVKNYFVLKNYFVILFLSSEMLFWAKKMIFLSNKTHFSEWSWLLNNFNKISVKKFLSGNILSHCVLSEMFSLAPEWNFLAMKSILLAGHDCWKSVLKLQLYGDVLNSCPAKNS